MIFPDLHASALNGVFRVYPEPIMGFWGGCVCGVANHNTLKFGCTLRISIRCAGEGEHTTFQRASVQIGGAGRIAILFRPICLGAALCANFIWSGA